MPPFLPLLASAAIAASALFTLPAHAVGRLIDVTVTDRDSGARLPLVRHDGQWWLAGTPGARYAVELRNASGARVLGVVSIDGVNVITGETAGWQQSGYVLDGWRSAQITGWRKSDTEVAAFHFAALRDAYATRTGRAQHVGVIGVAAFREAIPTPPPPAIAPAPQNDAADTTRENAAPEAEAKQSAQAPSARRAERAPSAAARLGTGHGARERSEVTHTQFERRADTPDEVITIRYDSRANLIAMGILPGPRAARPPQAFPASPEQLGYVPDPPARRW